MDMTYGAAKTAQYMYMHSTVDTVTCSRAYFALFVIVFSVFMQILFRGETVDYFVRFMHNSWRSKTFNKSQDNPRRVKKKN